MIHLHNRSTAEIQTRDLHLSLLPQRVPQLPPSREIFDERLTHDVQPGPPRDVVEREGPFFVRRVCPLDLHAAPEIRDRDLRVRMVIAVLFASVARGFVEDKECGEVLLAGGGLFSKG